MNTNFSTKIVITFFVFLVLLFLISCDNTSSTSTPKNDNAGKMLTANDKQNVQLNQSNSMNSAPQNMSKASNASINNSQTQPIQQASIKDEQTTPQIIQLKVGKIVFGDKYEEVDPATNNGRNLRIVNPQNTFRPNDPFSYIVMSEEPFGKTTIELVVSFVSEKGAETFIGRETTDIPDPAKHKNIAENYEKFAYFLLGIGRKSGKYKLRCFRDDTLLAEGEFIYQSEESNPR